VPDIRLIARDRTERLTNGETVKIGRILTPVLTSQFKAIWYPDGTPTVEIVIRDQDTIQLSDHATNRLREIVGEFDTAYP